MKRTGALARSRVPRAKLLLAGGLCLAAIGLYAWQLGLVGGGRGSGYALSEDERRAFEANQRAVQEGLRRPGAVPSGN